MASAAGRAVTDWRTVGALGTFGTRTYGIPGTPGTFGTRTYGTPGTSGTFGTLGSSPPLIGHLARGHCI